MLEHFTDRARKVMQVANLEAKRLNHEWVGTEHLLIAICKEGSCVAANLLRNLNILPDVVRQEVENILTPGPTPTGAGTLIKLPLTPRAKKVIDYAFAEAGKLDHQYIGTEHLLVGLVTEQEGVASQILARSGLTADVIHGAILRFLMGSPEDSKESQPDYYADVVARIKAACDLPTAEALSKIVAIVTKTDGLGNKDIWII